MEISIGFGLFWTWLIIFGGEGLLLFPDFTGRVFFDSGGRLDLVSDGSWVRWGRIRVDFAGERGCLEVWNLGQGLIDLFADDAFLESLLPGCGFDLPTIVFDVAVIGDLQGWRDGRPSLWWPDFFDVVWSGGLQARETGGVGNKVFFVGFVDQRCWLSLSRMTTGSGGGSGGCRRGSSY